MRTITYKVLEGRSVANATDLNERLNTLGQEGWILSGVNLAGDYILQREQTGGYGVAEARGYARPEAASRYSEPETRGYGRPESATRVAEPEAPTRVGSRRAKDLTPREEDIVRLLVGGKANRDIAQALGIKEQSVKNLVSKVMRKYGAENRTQLVLHFLQK
jgi:DNA-binding CsgD family transcriptional regulator